MTINDFKDEGVWRKILKEGGRSNYTKSYSLWLNIKRRCGNSYGENPTYKDVTICDEWLDFQNFTNWTTKQYGYDLDWHLDKDILVAGNKIYCPENCIFVPRALNNFLCLSQSTRGDCKLGVSKRGDRYITFIGINNKSIYLGLYDTEDEAFNAYKLAKECHAKELAISLKQEHPNLSDRLVEALLNWKVPDEL